MSIASRGGMIAIWKVTQTMPKLVWENNRQVPPAKNTKSHMRHYVPSGRDAFDQTYHHMMRIGAWQMQEFLRDKRQEQRQKALSGLRNTINRLKTKRDSQVVSFDNTGK